MENGENKNEKKKEVKIPPQRGQIKVRIAKEAAKKIQNVANVATGKGKKKIENIETSEEDWWLCCRNREREASYGV